MGYLLLEEPAEDRTFETWNTRASARLNTLGLSVKHAISDRAKALIKLSIDGFNCLSGADLFHAQYDLSRWFPAALSRTQKRAAKNLALAKKALNTFTQASSESTEREVLQTQVKQAASECHALEEAQATYRQCQQSISLAVHPFNIVDNQANSGETVIQALCTEADTLEALSQQREISDKDNSLKKFRRQIDDLGSHVDVWWQWVDEVLTHVEEPIKKWVLYDLMPVVYWHHRLQHCKNPTQRLQYADAWEKASRNMENKPLPLGMMKKQQSYWQTWCENKVQHFHRASSAVEGRNGCLAQMYHNGRGG